MVQFIALEVKDEEKDIQVLHRFYEVAHEAGREFRFVEPYGTFSLGKTKFLRFKTDCTGVPALLDAFTSEPRSVILPGPGGYKLVSAKTSGKVAIMPMQAARLPGYNRRYRGTTDAFWARQFSKQGTGK